MRLIGVDTESHGGVPWSIQASLQPGTAIMVLMSNRPAVEAMAECLNRCLDQGYELTFHNAPADIPVLKSIGVDCEGRYRDTMMELYHTGAFLRQGLKIAALRVLGRRRQSWEEVVGGASRQKLIEWLYEASMVAESWRRLEPRVSEKTGKQLKPTLIKHLAESELAHMMTHTSKSETYESWKKIAEFGWRESDWFGELERQVGRTMPIKGIGNCELSAAVEYGCQDASDHLELALALERMRVEVEQGWSVLEEDCDNVAGCGGGYSGGSGNREVREGVGAEVR
jgi:hypothetical protein